MYGEKVDAIDYYDSEIDRLTEEVPAFLFQVLVLCCYTRSLNLVLLAASWVFHCCEVLLSVQIKGQEEK
jgi:hypothetical protein